MRTSIVACVVAVVLAGGMTAAASPADNEEWSKVRQAIAVAMTDDIVELLEDQASGSSSEPTTINPFGLEVDRGNAPEITLTGVTASLVPGPVDAGPFSIFPDGPNTVDGDFLFGGVDDAFGVVGDYGVVTAAFTTEDIDADFVEVALLLTQAGFEVADPDPNLAIDPNAGKSLRVGVNRTVGVFDVTWEQHTSGSWQEFASPADIWVRDEDDTFYVSLALPPRFVTGLIDLEVHVSAIPLDSTDAASASVQILSLPSTLLPAGAPALTDEQLAVLDAVLAGDPSAGSASTEGTADEDTAEEATEDDTAAPEVEDDPVAEQPPTDEGEVEPDTGDESGEDAGNDGADGAVDESASQSDEIASEPIADPQPVDEAAAPAETGDETVETDGEGASGEESSGGGIGPLVPIGGGILGLIAVGGAVVVRRRKRPSPLVVDEKDDLPASPLDPADERRAARNDEVLAPHVLSPDDRDAAKQRVQMQIKQNLINDSLDDDTEVDGDWVKITQRAYDHITSVFGTADPELMEGRQQLGDAIVLLSDSGRLTPSPDEAELWINQETYSVDSAGFGGDAGEPSGERPIEHNDTMLGNDPGANKPGAF